MYSSLLSCRNKWDCRVWRGLSPEVPCSGPSGMSTTSLWAKHIHHQWSKKHSSLSSPVQSLPPQQSVRGFPGTWRLWLDICKLDTSASDTYQGQKYKWKGLHSSHSSWHPYPSSFFFRISLSTPSLIINFGFLVTYLQVRSSLPRPPCKKLSFPWFPGNHIWEDPAPHTVEPCQKVNQQHLILAHHYLHLQ